MEKKLNSLLKNKISKKFVAALENKLMSEYEPKANRSTFWRYSVAGFSLTILVLASMFFINPFSPQNNIVANALEYYRTLEDAPGIFYTKYKISITEQEGLETFFGNEYTEEAWSGDMGEYLLKVHGNREGTMLSTADGKIFSDNFFDNHGQSTTISCALNEQKGNNFMGRTLLDVEAEDYSQYEVYSSIQEYPVEDSQEFLPEEEWLINGNMPKDTLASIQQDYKFEVETTTLNGNKIFKITTERYGDSMEMYFEEDTLILKKVIAYPKEHPEFKTTIDYIEVKNITDISPKELFSPADSNLQEVYEETPYLEEVGCYSPDSKKMSEEEKDQLLQALPDSAKEQIEASGLTIKERLEELGQTKGE